VKEQEDVHVEAHLGVLDAVLNLLGELGRLRRGEGLVLGLAAESGLPLLDGDHALDGDVVVVLLLLLLGLGLGLGLGLVLRVLVVGFGTLVGIRRVLVVVLVLVNLNLLGGGLATARGPRALRRGTFEPSPRAVLLAPAAVLEALASAPLEGAMA